MMLIDRILVVGGGSVGQRHCGVVKEVLPHAMLILCSASGQTSKYADDHCRTLEESVQFNPHIAIVASKTARHMSDSLYLAQYGIHLLIEKPVSHSLDGLDELAKIATEKKIAIKVGYNLRYLDILIALKKCLDLKPDLGQLMRIDCECSSFLPHWRVYRHFRESNSVEQKGGGVGLELSHELDYLSWLFGGLEIMTVSSCSRLLDHKVNDFSVAVLKATVDGVIVPMRLTLDFFRRDAIREIVIVAMKGTIKIDILRGSVHIAPSILDDCGVHACFKDLLAISSINSHIASSELIGRTFLKQLQDFISYVLKGVYDVNQVLQYKQVQILATQI